MTLELINPDGLPTPESYTHIASATGRRVIFVGHRPPDTLLGVQTLFEPGYLIEVDAVAVAD